MNVTHPVFEIIFIVYVHINSPSWIPNIDLGFKRSFGFEKVTK